jgi:hypothetical protein
MLPPARAAGCRDADLILTNGKVVTMDAERRVVQALAVRGGRIVAVGSNEQVAACAGETTRRVDARGNTVLPGLIDVHAHAIEWAKSLLRDELHAGYPDVLTIVQAVEKVRQRVSTLPAGQWVVGYGWDDSKLEERRYIRRSDLDAVSPNHPVYLVHVTGHLSVANSVALQLAGITKNTLDPPGGLIERDAYGEPTGILKDNAMGLVARLLPPDPSDLAERAAALASEKAAEVGLTTIHDIWDSPEDMRGYQMAHRKGRLKVRVHIVPGVRNIADAERVAGMGIHTGFGNDFVRLGAVKLFADGGMGARTIAVYPPGVEGEPDNIGLLLWKSEDLQKAHRILARAGWQIVTHAIGDRAMDQVLDSYAAAAEELQLQDPRFRIAHGGISTPAIQLRLKSQRVLVDGNPSFLYWIGRYFARYGRERARWAYPGKSYFDHGIIAGAGSDVSVTPLSPWWGIYGAVTRKELFSGQVLAPEERLTLYQALQLFTWHGAYIGFEEKEKGALEAGKLGDFIVVDRDVLTVSAEQLKDVQVLKTFVGGELVHQRP